MFFDYIPSITWNQSNFSKWFNCSTWHPTCNIPLSRQLISVHKTPSVTGLNKLYFLILYRLITVLLFIFFNLGFKYVITCYIVFLTIDIVHPIRQTNYIDRINEIIMIWTSFLRIFYSYISDKYTKRSKTEQMFG